MTSFKRINRGDYLTNWLNSTTRAGNMVTSGSSRLEVFYGWTNTTMSYEKEMLYSLCEASHHKSPQNQYFYKLNVSQMCLSTRRRGCGRRRCSNQTGKECWKEERAEQWDNVARGKRLSLPPGVRRGVQEVREMGVSAVWVVGPQGRTELLGRVSGRK